MDQLRGTHSVGVGIAGRGKATAVVKSCADPATFLGSKKAKNRIGGNIQHARALIGHNRYATQGAINAVNAHPFEHGDIMGAHNGTLIYQDLLPDAHQFEVDSENIIHSINKIGIDETVPLLDGAYALTYWNKEDETLNIIRNNERPLHWAKTNDGATMFWASEKYMLLAALNRNYTVWESWEEADIFEIAEDTLYTFDIPKIAKSKYLGFEIPKPKCKHLHGYFRSYAGNKVNTKKPKGDGKVVDFSKGFLHTLGLKATDPVWWCPTGDTAGDYVLGFLYNNFETPVEMKITDSVLREEVAQHNGVIESKSIQAYFAPNSSHKDGLIRVGKDFTQLTWMDVSIPDGEPDVDEVVDFEIPDDLTLDDIVDDTYVADCNWCSSPITNEEDYKKFEEGEYLCEACLNDVFPEYKTVDI